MSAETTKDPNDEYRAQTDRVRFLRIPAHRFVQIDGSGPPGDEAFGPRVPGLYGTAYGLRFALKRRGIEGHVAPLEGLWWTTNGNQNLDRIFAGDRATWRWTLMIALPSEATEEEAEQQLELAKANLDTQFAASLRIEVFEEGDAAQIMHIGPYAEERPTVERLHAGILDAGLRPRGRHHEIYLGDPRRTKPERLRTVLRQPVVEAGSV